MFASLAKLAALPGDTMVYCTHEYTLSNLAFAAAVEPDNGAIAERIVASQALRAANRPTVPFRWRAKC
jgi:hydroxyacylglutathione hydrolase